MEIFPHKTRQQWRPPDFYQTTVWTPSDFDWYKVASSEWGRCGSRKNGCCLWGDNNITRTSLMYLWFHCQDHPREARMDGEFSLSRVSEECSVWSDHFCGVLCAPLKILMCALLARVSLLLVLGAASSLLPSISTRSGLLQQPPWWKPTIMHTHHNVSPHATHAPHGTHVPPWWKPTNMHKTHPTPGYSASGPNA